MHRRARFWTRRFKGSGCRRSNPDQVNQAELMTAVCRIAVDQDVRGFQVAVRERTIVEGSDELGKRYGQAADPSAADLRRQARQHLAGIGRQVDGVLLLDGDQVGFVRQEPE